MKPIATIRLKLFANRAAPSPVLGQALGQYSINIMDFCKAFNNATKNLSDTFLIPVKVIIYPGDLKIIIKTPSTSDLVKKIAYNNSITLKQVYHIGVLKQASNLYNVSLHSICKSIVGSIKSLRFSIASTK